MPFYNIHHSTPLTTPQRTSLAQKITDLHCKTFSAPSIFVNIRFTGPQSQPNKTAFATPSPPETTNTAIFIGGQPEKPNLIYAHLRPRTDLPAEQKRDRLNKLVADIVAAWNQVVRNPLEAPTGIYVRKEPSGRLDDERALHTVFLMSDIDAGYEQGLVIPAAGDDWGFVESRMGEVEGRAGGGEEGMRRLVEEFKGRG